MRRSTPIALLLIVLLTFVAACRSRKTDTSAAAVQAAVRSAHEQYVAAINANKVDSWMATLTDDVVYMVPNRQPIVGKANVGTWASGYLDESTTHWTKTVINDFVVAGDWAFARYAYSVSDTVIIKDTSVDGGGTSNDTGWGFIVYHRDSDGTWRVARDAWGSDRPAR